MKTCMEPARFKHPVFHDTCDLCYDSTNENSNGPNTKHQLNEQAPTHESTNGPSTNGPTSTMPKADREHGRYTCYRQAARNQRLQSKRNRSADNTAYISKTIEEIEHLCQVALPRAFASELLEPSHPSGFVQRDHRARQRWRRDYSLTRAISFSTNYSKYSAHELREKKSSEMENENGAKTR